MELVPMKSKSELGLSVDGEAWNKFDVEGGQRFENKTVEQKRPAPNIIYKSYMRVHFVIIIPAIKFIQQRLTEMCNQHRIRFIY